jgi:hypothetical protein
VVNVTSALRCVPSSAYWHPDHRTKNFSNGVKCSGRGVFAVVGHLHYPSPNPGGRSAKGCTARADSHPAGPPFRQCRLALSTTRQLEILHRDPPTSVRASDCVIVAPLQERAVSTTFMLLSTSGSEKAPVLLSIQVCGIAEFLLPPSKCTAVGHWEF